MPNYASIPRVPIRQVWPAYANVEKELAERGVEIAQFQSATVLTGPKDTERRYAIVTVSRGGKEYPVSGFACAADYTANPRRVDKEWIEETYFGALRRAADYVTGKRNA